MESASKSEDAEEDLFGSNLPGQEAQSRVIDHQVGVGCINKYAREDGQESGGSDSDSLFGQESAREKSSEEKEEKEAQASADNKSQQIEEV